MIRTITVEIAQLAQVDRASVERLDERCDSLFYRLMKVYMRGSSADAGNCVIVGRGAPHLLRHRPDATRYLYHQMINSKVGDELVVRAIINEVLDIDAHSEAAPHMTEDAR